MSTFRDRRRVLVRARRDRRRIAWAILWGEHPVWPVWSYGRMISLGFHWVEDSAFGGHWEPNG